MSKVALREQRPRRGVQMTASARGPRAGRWKEEIQAEEEEEDGGGRDGGDIETAEAKASKLEWQEIEREVELERRKLQLVSSATGERVGTVAYDDVAEGSGDEDGASDVDDASESGDAAAVIAQQARDGHGLEATVSALPLPEGVVTAGQAVKGEKKRAGQKRTGAMRRKRGEPAGGDGEAGEDGADDDVGNEDAEKKRKLGDPSKKKGSGKGKGKDDDPDRWVKLRLQGEEKPKRIDATRVVSYFDFDTKAAQQRAAQEAASSGDFRSRVRADLYDDDEEWSS